MFRYLANQTKINVCCHLDHGYSIKECQENNNIFEVSVEFVSEIISCIKDKDQKILSGDPKKIKKVLDLWKFSRDTRSNNPNWLLVDTQR